jgi:hypothetical protein
MTAGLGIVLGKATVASGRRNRSFDRLRMTDLKSKLEEKLVIPSVSKDRFGRRARGRNFFWGMTKSGVSISFSVDG